MSNQRRNHTREFKLQCCRQAATGEKRPAQICREHNLSESVLLRWRKEYEARGEVAFEPSLPLRPPHPPTIQSYHIKNGDGSLLLSQPPIRGYSRLKQPANARSGITRDHSSKRAFIIFS